MTLTIPKLSLVVLVGASGSGKSTLAARHFRPTEVISSDFCRGLVADDENDQTATRDAFEVLDAIVAKRLERGNLTVVDATNVQPEARKPLVELARRYHCIPVAVVLNLPESVCLQRNQGRADRSFGPHVIRSQRRNLEKSLRTLKKEGFRHLFVLGSEEEVDAATFVRQPLWNDRRDEHGPFDIVGDVHGCLDELLELLSTLGYEVRQDPTAELGWQVMAPAGRRLLFLGDLVDRGPSISSVLRLVMSMVQSGLALCVPGNHDQKLVKALKGRQVQVSHGLADSLAQLERESPEFRTRVTDFLDGLVSHYVLDDGNLVIAHAGMKEEMQGRGSGAVRDFALYGETTGETDEYGLPVRVNWAADYRGKATVVYGHVPVLEPCWTNRTIDIDTGCVYGGALTALRYPEREFVSVPARRVYYQPARPLTPPTEQEVEERSPEVLDLNDVLGKRCIETRLRRTVTVREENARAALEEMSRWAVDLRWLIYLPPTMSPAETSALPDYLEHPAEAFAYYRTRGIEQVVCEEKHMGSRVTVIVARDEEALRRRFGFSEGSPGVCYTRTGRRFFTDDGLQEGLLSAVSSACTGAGLWERLETDWACLDCELMPWSAKAQDLIREQYAPVGAAARGGLAHVLSALSQAQSRGVDTLELVSRYRNHEADAERFVEAYQRYCWRVTSLSDLKLAPFHLLATEGHVYADRDHTWHLEILGSLCQAAQGILCETRHRVVALDDPRSCQAAADWWEELTAGGGEGMVVKPLQFTAYGKGGLLQPAVKCRGREYLRIIYGPGYTRHDQLERLKKRGLNAKRSLALREFALGIEGLERFVRGEPLYHVHECAFAVLALESEPVDPRL